MRPAIRRTFHTEPGGLRLAFAALITSSSAAVTPAVPAWLSAAAAVRSTKALRASAATTASSSCSTPPPAYRAPGRSVPYLPGFRGRIDRMLGRSPGECRKGQHAPTWRKAADDQLAAYPDVPAGRNTRRSSRSPCALRVLSRRVPRMTPKRRKRRGESVPSPEQDKAEVVRAVLTRREIGVVTSAAAETARDHRHATLLLWPGGRNPPPPTSTRPVDPDVVPTHGDVIVSEGSGDEVLRGEDVVAHKPVSTNCPPPLRPGPASSCLVTAIGRNENYEAGY